MDSKSQRILQILDELSKDSHITQRDLSKRLGVALGLVNRYVKRLIKKGCIEVAQVERNRLHYLVTPKGIKEKSALTYNHLQRAYNLFKELKERSTVCFKQLAEDGAKRIVFYGTSEVAEVAFLSLHTAGLTLVGVVDSNISRKESCALRVFCGYPVISMEALKNIAYDKVIIVQLDYEKDIEKTLVTQGVPEEKICWFGNNE